MTQRDVFFYRNGDLTKEDLSYNSSLYFLYNTLWGKIFRSLFFRRTFCKLGGFWYDLPMSKRAIRPFIKKYNINMSEFNRAPDAYVSFNDFFCRELKPGARKIDPDARTIISPADSKLFVIPEVKSNNVFGVKNKLFNLELFLRDKKRARDYVNGTLLIFRLAPPDYHRFHFPCDGIADKACAVKGHFESVHTLVYKAGYIPIESNERHIISFNSTEYNKVLIIPVGAMMVGKIIETYIPGKLYHKGDETGYFAFGGSTVVLLFKQNIIQVRDDLISHSIEGFETEVKMGEVIACKK